MSYYLSKILTFFKHLFSGGSNPARELPPVDPVVIPPVEESPEPTVKIVDGVAVPFVKIGNIKAFNSERQNILEGVDILNRVLATDLFKQKVLKAQFTETRGLPNPAIYKLFCSKIQTVDVNVFLGSKYQNHISKTIGYETEPGVVNVNRFFVSTPLEFADNIIHEVLGHSFGFSHYQYKGSSVPYVLNTIFEECCAEMGIK